MARRQLGLWTVELLGPLALRSLARSWETVLLGVEQLEDAEGDGQGHFMSMWHGRMLLGIPHHGPRGWHVLVSQSGDGDVSNTLLKAFGFGVVRGSSSRGGVRALREMMAVLGPGRAVVLTPDGPRGPRHSMNPGVAWLARATGCPVVPMGYACDRGWRANSWDAFTIPKFRAKVVIAYAEPVRVARDADQEQMNAATQTIRERMFAAERAAFASLGMEPDW